MPLFLILYLISGVVVSLLVFILSLLEKGRKPIKIALTVILIVSILGVIFATGCLEVKYAYSKLFSSVIAAGIVLCLYCADTLGGKLAHNREEKSGL